MRLIRWFALGVCAVALAVAWGVTVAVAADWTAISPLVWGQKQTIEMADLTGTWFFFALQVPWALSFLRRPDSGER